MSEDITVRRMTPEDVDGHLEVLREVADERIYIATEPGFDADARRRRILDDLAGGGRSWVADEAGAIVGSLGMHPVMPGVADIGIALRAAVRGRGVGRRLLAAALDDARADTDWHKLTLEVFLENARAIALYAHAGFVVEGLRRDQYLRMDGSRRSALMMALFL